MIESEADLVINDMAIRILDEQGDGVDPEIHAALKIEEIVLIGQGE